MKHEISRNYQLVLNTLKEKIKQARLKAAYNVNTELLKIYWEIGKTIAEQEKGEGWGAKTVDTLSKDLRAEFYDMKGLSPRYLSGTCGISRLHIHSSLFCKDSLQIRLIRVPLCLVKGWSHRSRICGINC